MFRFVSNFLMRTFILIPILVSKSSVDFKLILFLIIFFMPIVGLFLICGKDPDKKPIGWVLLIIGIILWIVVGVMSA